MNVKKWLSASALVGAGFVTGVAAEAASREILEDCNSNESKTETGDLWKGRTKEWVYPKGTAHRIIDSCEYHLAKEWWDNDVHYDEDIRSIKAKFAYALGDIRGTGISQVSVELHDRERLVLYHIYPAAASESSNEPIRDVKDLE